MNSVNTPPLIQLGRRAEADIFPVSSTGVKLMTGALIPVVLAYALVTADALRVLAVVLALIVVLGILARPFLGLIVFMGLVYIRPENMIPALLGMQLTLMVSIVTLTGMWFQLFLDREKAVRTPVNALLLGFFGMTILSTLSGGDPLAAAQDIGKLVILVLLVFNLVREPRRYQTYVTAILLLTTYLAVFSIYEYFTGLVMLTGEVKRAVVSGVIEGSVFSNPNDLAVVLVPGIALCLTRLRQAKGTARLLNLALCGVILWAILLTNSRSGLLATLVTVGGFLISMSQHKGRAIALAVMACLAILPLASSRMKNFDSKEMSANSRLECWNNGIAFFLHNPVTGIGYNQFERHNDGVYAHNTFVCCFAELGFPGYFFWIGCLYYCYRRSGERRGAEGNVSTDLVGARLALTGYLTAGFFGNYTYMPITYILIAMPIVQQIAASGNCVLLPLTPAERFKDCRQIALICLGSILLMRVVIPFLL